MKRERRTDCIERERGCCRRERYCRSSNQSSFSRAALWRHPLAPPCPRPFPSKRPERPERPADRPAPPSDVHCVISLPPRCRKLVALHSTPNRPSNEVALEEKGALGPGGCLERPGGNGHQPHSRTLQRPRVSLYVHWAL